MNAEVKKYKRGDVLFADLGEPVGGELGHRRPVIVIQRNDTIPQSEKVIVALITGKTINAISKALFQFKVSSSQQVMTILLDNIRTIDKCRLVRYVGHFNGSEIEGINAALAYAVGLDEVSDK